jgi:hypothetical protein
MSQGIAKKMCFSKRRYPSEFLVNMGIETIQKHNPEKAHVKLRAYNCPHCLGWHITSARKESPGEKFAKLKYGIKR